MTAQTAPTGLSPAVPAAGAAASAITILRRPDSGDGDRDLFEDLFARRISAVANGSVRVVSAVRHPGERTVVVVVSAVPGLDGAAVCRGANDARVRDIEEWFPGEHIDIVNADSLTAAGPTVVPALPARSA